MKHIIINDLHHVHAVGPRDLFDDVLLGVHGLMVGSEMWQTMSNIFNAVFKGLF